MWHVYIGRKKFIIISGDGCKLNYGGDHFAVYTNIKSLGCTPEYAVTCLLYLNKNKTNTDH